MQKSQGTHYVSFSAEINPTTAEGLLAACTQLATNGAREIYLLLSSPGGSTMHGLTIYNLLRGLPLRLTTHNVGNVDSIANAIFLAGTRRYSCPHATFMFHGVSQHVNQPTRLDQKNLRERMDLVAADQDRIGQVIVDRTSLTEEEVRDLFLEAKTRNPDYALSKGIIDEIRDVDIPAGFPVHQLVFQR